MSGKQKLRPQRQTKAASMHIEVMPFQDGFFPEQGDAIKSWFEKLKARLRVS